MKIILNQQVESLPDNISIIEMLKACRLPTAGVAVAVNNKLVSSSSWVGTTLRDGDHVLVITAACGG